MIRLAAMAALTSLAVSGCTLAGDNDDEEDTTDATKVVLITHDSFALPDEVIAQFEKDSGLELEIRQSGEGGELTNKLVLTKENPLGDAAFGVDNTFASRALDEGVFAEGDVDLPPGADELTVPGDDGKLVPIDQGSVCVNVDKAWFEAKKQAPPVTLEDLTKPDFKDLFVVPGASSSSPGMAFLLTTIAEYGDEWPSYWARLLANGTKIVKGWEDAYTVDFTAGNAEGKGTRPIVLSYDSSPAFTVNEKGESTTAALLDTCFRQVEYAGVLENAENPDGARELIRFLLSDQVQSALPESMYVFPVDGETELPEDWAKHAVQPETPYSVDAEEVAENRDEWLTEWTDVTTR